MSPTYSELSGQARETVGLVVADVGQYVIGIPIQAVDHIITATETIAVPNPKPCIRSLFVYNNKLVPIIDLRQVLEEKSTGQEPYLLIVRERDRVFAFPIGYVERVSQLPASRVRFPRDIEIAIDKDFVRGYWDFSRRRHGYILNCSAVYDTIFPSTDDNNMPEGVEEQE
jgi:chemotaxis signal transduction protein